MRTTRILAPDVLSCIRTRRAPRNSCAPPVSSRRMSCRVSGRAALPATHAHHPYPRAGCLVVYQDAPRPPQLMHTTQTAHEYSVKFDPLRRKAESQAQMGGAFPETSVPIPRTTNASLRRADKSPALGSAQGSLGTAAATTIFLDPWATVRGKACCLLRGMGKSPGLPRETKISRRG